MKLLLLCSFIGFTMANLLGNIGSMSRISPFSSGAVSTPDVSAGSNAKLSASGGVAAGANIKGLLDLESDFLASAVSDSVGAVGNMMNGVENNVASAVNDFPGTIADLEASLDNFVSGINLSINTIVNKLANLLKQLTSKISALRDSEIAQIASKLTQLAASTKNATDSIDNIIYLLNQKVNQSEQCVDNLAAKKTQLISNLIQITNATFTKVIQEGLTLDNLSKEAIENAINTAFALAKADIAFKVSLINQLIAIGQNLSAKAIAAILDSIITLKSAIDVESALLNVLLANATAADYQKLNDLKNIITTLIPLLEKIRSVASNNIQALLDQLIKSCQTILSSLPSVSANATVTVGGVISGNGQTANGSSGNAGGNVTSAPGSTNVGARGSANAYVSGNVTVGA